jgi:hypothetical protein
MKRKAEVEAALESSLRNQVKVPRLDGRFDAAVWARIAAEESRAVSSSMAPIASPLTARWLGIINILGLVTVAIVVWIYGAPMLAGADVSESWTELSAATRERIVEGASMGLAVVALVFGMMFTPWGRRLRAELG